MNSMDAMKYLQALPPPPDLTDSLVKLRDSYSEGGRYGDVYMCRYNNGPNTKKVAVKALRVVFDTKDESDKHYRMFRRELGIWRRLKHKNIVPFLGVAHGFGREGAVSFVSLWMPNGTLGNFLKEHENELNTAHRLRLLLDIAHGLDYLHSFTISDTRSPIIHGDLYPNNVLICEDYTARLTDFGFASLMGEIPEIWNYLQRSTGRPGALRWSAPEQILGDTAPGRAIKSDIYSFGNIALQVLSDRQPWSEFPAEGRVAVALYQDEKPARPDHRPIEDPHWDFINRCWTTVDERPEGADLVLALEQFLSDYPNSQPLSELFTSSSKYPTPIGDSSVHPSAINSEGFARPGESSRFIMNEDCADGTNSVPTANASPVMREEERLTGTRSHRDGRSRISLPNLMGHSHSHQPQQATRTSAEGQAWFVPDVQPVTQLHGLPVADAPFPVLPHSSISTQTGTQQQMNAQFNFNPSTNPRTTADVQSPQDQMHGLPHSAAQPMGPRLVPGAQQQNGQKKIMTLAEFQERIEYLLGVIFRSEATLSSLSQAAAPNSPIIDSPIQQKLNRLHTELTEQKEVYNKFVAAFWPVVLQQMVNDMAPFNMEHNMSAMGSSPSQQSQQAAMTSVQGQASFMQTGQSVAQKYDLPVTNVPSPMLSQSQNLGNLSEQIPMPPQEGPNQMWQPIVMPMDKQRFETTYLQFCRSQQLNPVLWVLLPDNRMVELHQLHVQVMREGGEQTVTQRDMWSIVGARLGFIQFPSTDTEPARCAPGTAQHLQHTYEGYLQHFEHAYVARVKTRTTTAPPQQPMQPMNPLVPGNVAVPGMSGNPSQITLSTSRPTYPQQLLAKRNGEQEPQNVANGPRHMPNMHECGRHDAWPKQMGAPLPLGRDAAAPVEQPTQDQIQHAILTIASLKNVFQQRRLGGMPTQQIPDEQRLEYNQLLEQVHKMSSELDMKLHMYFAILKNEEILRKSVAIVMTVARQRQLVSTSSPQYIISLTILRSMQVQIQKFNEEFEGRWHAIKVASAYGFSQ